MEIRKSADAEVEPTRFEHFKVFADHVEVRYGHELMRIEPWGASSFRIRAGQNRVVLTDIGALDLEPPVAATEVSLGSSEVTLRNGKLQARVRIDKSLANPAIDVSFTHADTHRELLSEQREHPWSASARVYIGNRGGSYEIHQQFAAHDDEKLFGMGQHQHGRLNLKGLGLDLTQRNGEVNIPFVISNRGYGLLWNNAALGRVEFGVEATRWTVGQARQLDYWITAGDTPADILESYVNATGHSPALPLWASGFWQSKLRYRTQEELLSVAREFQSRQIPLSVIVCDYFHWSAMGEYRFDDAEWPDPAAMVAELRESGIELMVSIWPTVSPLAYNYAEYREMGMLVGSDQGVEVHQSIRDKGMSAPLPVSIYDATNPETRRYVWELVRKNYARHGIKVWWLDAAEPEIYPANPGNLTFYAGPGSEVANVFPRDNARLFSEGSLSDGVTDGLMLSRSAWAGSQKYGTAVWSGDIPSTWESLGIQIRAGLNIGLSGIPWWTTDIGGFHGGNADDPAYQELIVRWFQFGVFCPLFRLHGDREPRTPTGFTQTGGPNEPWSFGSEASELIVALIRLRERLRPYIHVHMRKAAQSGMPIMRPIFVDYPTDTTAWSIDDQYMFGDDILVAPVYFAGAIERRVYLPEGSDWVFWVNGKIIAGGSWVTIPVGLETIPVFFRAGFEPW